MSEKIEPYIPVFKRPPNTFVRYEERPFDDGVGHRGIEVVAIFLSKKQKLTEMTAFIRWEQ